MPMFDGDQVAYQPSPWRRERRVTLTTTQLVVALLLTFLLGWCIGQMTTPDVDPKPKVDVHAQDAQNYADWCGGYVQTVGTDITVQGCDR